MKIKKTASGPKIILSQKEWEDFGKKAGWMNEEGNIVEAELSMSAPVAPPERRTTPTETPTTPTKKPSRRQRRDPEPKTRPAPKGEGKKKDLVEEKVSPDHVPTIASELKKNLIKVKSSTSIVANRNPDLFQKLAQVYPGMYENFWENIPEDYAISNSDFIRTHGASLSRGNYDYLIAHSREKNLPIPNGVGEAVGMIQQILGQIQRIEGEHKEELTELAKDVVAEEWNIDREMLDASFMDQVEGSGSPPQQEGDEVPLTPELRDEIGKRSVLNGISQGAGLHALLGIHHHPLARDVINNMDEQLLGLYDKFGSLISLSYYMMSPEQLRGLEDMLANSGTGWSETDEDGNVEGKGLSFSIICQELVKGLVAKYTNHQFDDQSRMDRGQEPLSEEEERTILNNSDKLSLEPLQIQFGTELWRKFLDSSPDDVDKIDVISYMSASSVPELDETATEITTNPERARELVSNMQRTIEETDFGYKIEAEEDEFGADEHEVELGLEDGDAPDDWEDIQRQLGDLFTQPDRPDIDRGQGPVDLDDDDDDDDDDQNPFFSF